MSISSVSHASDATQIVPPADKKLANVAGLKGALQSGDLAAARSAFDTIMQIVKNAPTPNAQLLPSGSSMTLRDEFQKVGKALKVGDVAAAKEAFTALQQDVRTLQNASGLSPSRITLLRDEFQKIGDAVKAGDVAATQAGFVTMQHDLQTFGVTYRNHLANREADSTAATEVAAASPESDASTPGGSTQIATPVDTGLQNVVGLKGALQAGDLAAARSAFDTLVQVVKSAPRPNTQMLSSSTTVTLLDEFQKVGKALKSGDVTAAKAAFAALQQDVRTAQDAAGVSPGRSELLRDEFQKVGDAVTSGDVTATQEAFATMQHEVQMLRSTYQRYHTTNPEPDSTAASERSFSSRESEASMLDVKA